MRKFISIFAFLFLFVTTRAYSQATDEKKEELLSLHAVTKYCRYNNGSIIPQGGSSLSISLTGIAGGWPDAGSQAAPDSVPLPNLFNEFDSVVPFPDYHRDWFYPPGELDARRKLLADMWRNNRQAGATAEYGKRSDGYQNSRLEHTRTWVTANEPVSYERKRHLRVSTKLTVDDFPFQAQERIVTATIPAKDTHSSSLDLKPGSLWVKVNGASIERPFTKTYKEEVSVSLLPVRVVSRDKFLAGSILIPSEWNSLEMEFVGPAGSLGKYGNLLGGGTTKIYDRLEDILSEADYKAGIQSAAQKVWFARNASDPRKIDFYTCFDSIGNTQVKLYLNGGPDPIGEVAHLLKADPDMAAWIEYTDQWVKGTSFDWGTGGTDPPGLALMRSADGFSAASSIPQELDNLTRAALIPVFIAVESVEGMAAFMRGLLEGAKAGLIDDAKLIAAVAIGTAVAGDWLVENASYQINLLISDPQWRAAYFKDILTSAVEEYIIGTVEGVAEKLGYTLASWENLKEGAMNLWDEVWNTGVRLYIDGGQLAGKISDGIKAWHDKFADRMLEGAEKVSFKNTPWEGDIFFAGAANLTAMNYAAGFMVGYVCEQIALGKGLSTVGKVLARAGASVFGKLALRTTFAITTRLHQAKKVVRGWIASLEMNLVIERGLSRTGREAVEPLVHPTVISESLEKTLRELGDARARYNAKTIMDDLQNLPNIRKLTAKAGFEALFAQRLAKIGEVLGAARTAEGLKGFTILYERSLWIDASTGAVRDHFDDLLRVFDPGASPQAAARLNTALEKYVAGAADLDLDMITYRYTTMEGSKALPAGAVEHAGVLQFRDRVEALWPELPNGPTRKYEGVAAARYEKIYNRILRRTTSNDIPVNHLKVDYADVNGAANYIDVKGPILDNPGAFYETSTEAAAGVSDGRLLGLAKSSIDRIVDNAALSPAPIPTVVVLDLFGLSWVEKLIVRTKLRAEGLARGVDLSKIIIID